MSCLVFGACQIASGSPTFASLCRTLPSHHPLSTLSRIFPCAGARFSTQLIVSAHQLSSCPFPSLLYRPDLPRVSIPRTYLPIGQTGNQFQIWYIESHDCSHLQELCSFAPLLRPPPATSFLSIQYLISEYVSLGMTCSRSSLSIVFALVAVSFAFPLPIPTLVINHTWFVSQCCPSIVFTFCSPILRRICPLLVTSP